VVDFSLVGNPEASGWVPPEERSDETNRATDAAIAAMPKFAIGGATESSAGKRVVLWEAERKVLGKLAPTLHQLKGSCVFQGFARAIMSVQAVEIANGQRETFRIPSLYYSYGLIRKRSGMGTGKGDGATGSGAAESAKIDGVCPIDKDGFGFPVPSIKDNNGQDVLVWGEENEWKYSTATAVPAEAREYAKDFVIRSTALVTTYEEVRDALVNGYPVTVASNRGFKMQGVADKGKLWGVKSGVWNHQMCFIGVDDTQRPGCYCMNSWGPWVHGKPVDDAPPGGFWVDADVVESMVRQNDSFAFSQFDGFPAQKLDFSLIG
jgi:hypothetical protein